MVVKVGKLTITMILGMFELIVGGGGSGACEIPSLLNALKLFTMVLLTKGL